MPTFSLSRLACRQPCIARVARDPLHYAKKAFPILEWLPKYQLGNLPYDVIAGVTIGLTLLPVSLAYAQMAYLRPEYGLYSSFFGQIIYMFIGTSKDAVVGPSAVGSMLVSRFNLMNPLSEEGDNTYATAIAFVSGLVIMLIGLFRLGFVANFFSIPVISGFSTAACFAIIGSQLKSLFGIHTPFTGTSFVFVRHIKHVVDNKDEIRIIDIIFGASFVVFLISVNFCCAFIVRCLAKRTKSVAVRIVSEALRMFAASRNAVVFITATAISYYLIKHYDDEAHHLTVVGYIKPGLPTWQMPRFYLENSTLTENASNGTSAGDRVIETPLEMLTKLATPFLVMPLMSIAEMFAIVRAMSRKNGYYIRPANELVAVGLANTLQSFLGAHPITVATAKTVLNDQCKVKSLLSSLLSATIVIISTATLTEVFFFVPKAVLAAILIEAATHLFDLRTAVDIWRLNKPDLFFFVFTFLVCLFYNLAFGVLAAIGLSLINILWSNVRESHIAILSVGPTKKQPINSHLLEVTVANAELSLIEPATASRSHRKYFTERGTIVVLMRREVRFPGADNFVLRMSLCLENPTGDGAINVKRMVIDGRFLRSVDYTALQAWRYIMTKAATQKKQIIFRNFSKNLRHKLEMISPPDADFMFISDHSNDPIGGKSVEINRSRLRLVSESICTSYNNTDSPSHFTL